MPEKAEDTIGGITVLPALTHPVRVAHIEHWRDGSTEVVLEDATGRCLPLWFSGASHGLFQKLEEGTWPTADTLKPIVADSEADTTAVTWLWQHLECACTPEERTCLAEYDGGNGVRGLSASLVEAYRLLHHLAGWEERRKQARYGITPDTVRGKAH